MVLPESNFVANSSSEQYLWDLFKQILPEDYVSFHNYYLGLRQPDIILLVPQKGVLIIENKGYLAKNIIDVPDKSTIRRKNNPPEGSPFDQAKSYWQHIINNYLTPANINSVYVVPCISFPNISEDEYKKIGLAKIADRRLAFLKQDFLSRETLLNRINEIFDLAYSTIHMIGLEKNAFSPELLNKVGNLISPDYDSVLNNHEDKPDAHENSRGYLTAKSSIKYSNDPSVEYFIPEAQKQEIYSRLVYSDTGAVFTDDMLKSLFNDWMSGTKLQLFTSNPDVHKQILGFFKKEGNERHLVDQLTIQNGLSFRLEIGLANGHHEDFTLINGENYEQYHEALLWLHTASGFNYGQYEMEHAPTTNIIVKAGAGTGKTFSLISRINYLIWKEQISPEEFAHFMIMITFTNEAAEQMENGLIENFLTYYQLTHNVTFLQLLEAVEDVKISTIDSLVRAILSRFGTKLGLGENFRITTGIYRRNQLLRKNLDAYIQAHPDEIQSITNHTKLTMFYLEQRLCHLMDKFDNKNVNLADPDISFGAGTQALPDGLIDVIRNTQAELSTEAKADNAVCLGDLIRKLSQLSETLSPADITDDMRIRFLFVDEFQDTDDVQIELIQKFQVLIGFKVFAVGDIKQCIYRFRGAETAAFKKLSETISEADLKTISLNKNYRTDRLLLEEMNTVFAVWDQNGDLDYHGDDVLTATKDYNSENEFHRMIAYKDGNLDEESFCTLLRECLAATEEATHGKGKVAILVRYNFDIAKIVEICRRNKIAVSTDVGGELFKVDPTIDMHKLLLALRYNSDAPYLYNLYTTSFIREPLDKTALLKLNREELVNYFNEHCPIEHWQHYLEELKTEPILKVLQEIVNDLKPSFNFAHKVAPDASAEERLQYQLYYMRNLDTLFENLIQISNTDYLTLNKLTDYLETMILTRQEADTREQFGIESANTNLICTTIHKSKGLQFDTVIMPYCSFDISNKRNKGDVDVIFEDNKVGYRIADRSEDNRNLHDAFINSTYLDYRKEEKESKRLEEMRILYVALTRTQRRFYCYIPKDLSKPGSNSAVTWAHKLNRGK